MEQCDSIAQSMDKRKVKEILQKIKVNNSNIVIKKDKSYIKYLDIRISSTNESE